MFNYGDSAVIRGTIHHKLWLMQSVTVVKDTAQETLLLLSPGAECAYPSGYWQWKLGKAQDNTRWDDMKSMAWTLRVFQWHTHQLLIHMVPEKYFATYMIWEHATGIFKGYYINFQTPFQRSQHSFDTLDLELDIVIKPDFTWSYKDKDNYLLGLREGCITKTQQSAVEQAQTDALSMIRSQSYPLDGTWRAFQPDAAWTPPRLPEGWQTMP